MVDKENNMTCCQMCSYWDSIREAKMRISKSDGYHHGDCDILRDCGRFYCHKHRFLWSACDSIVRGTEGDQDVVNGTHERIEIGDCPLCEREEDVKRTRRLIEQNIARQKGVCSHGFQRIPGSPYDCYVCSQEEWKAADRMIAADIEHQKHNI